MENKYATEPEKVLVELVSVASDYYIKMSLTFIIIVLSLRADSNANIV